jgi:pSer/pThr/pTyr-binding forkhead associated (FHA) protein
VPDVFCNNCGHQNPLGANFCSSCGNPLEADPGERTTVTFAIEGAESPEEDVAFDLDDIPKGNALLVVTRGPTAGSRLAITKPLTTLGRHPGSDIFLDDITVSRRHAEIERTANGFKVRDAGSLNGTYLNRERVETADIKTGDELQVGKFKLAFFASPAEK